MEEERLTHMLHALPRERARVGFTARVLRRLDAEPETGSSRLHASRLHRLMLASATVAAVAVSVALLPREHTPLPLNVTLAPAGMKMAAAALQPAADPRRSPQPLRAQAAVSRPAEELDAAQAHQLVQELRQESSRLERELRSLQRPVTRRASAPAAENYRGGDDSADLVYGTARARTLQVTPPADRDDGELNNFLD
jgi:hypothetical protein